MNGHLAVFYVLAALSIGSAVAMLTSRSLIHAVLFMVANFALTGGLYLLLQAPFIAVVQVVVYAGAIMVLFLFVVMLLGDLEMSLAEPLAGQRLWGLTFVLVLAALLVYMVIEGVPAAPPGGVTTAQLPAAGGAFGSPQAVGALLYTQYLLPFELVSVLLLVAIIGAVVIARFRSEQRGIGPSGKEPS